MRFVSTVFAGCLASTTAFLVPPSIPEDFKDLRFKDGPPEFVKDLIHTLLEGKTTSVDLACPDCAFASPKNEDGPSWQEDIENVIVGRLTKGYDLY